MNAKLLNRVLIGLMCLLLLQRTTQAGAVAPAGQSQEQSQAPAPAAQPSAQEPTKPTPQELQQLVAPIALYPDALVAQVLAASTYPTQIVEADRWMQSHSKLKGEELAAEVDKQSWDPSVKALTQFPSVLENMDKNLSWSSSLGDAYANDPQAVTDTVQTLRQEAQKAGKLNSNDQENVTSQGNTIVIEPANPDVVYVPAYDPWLVYGGPIVAFPGWYPEPGIFFGGPGLFFGAGFGIGFFGGFGWGWHHWGYDWHGRHADFDHNTYISHSRTIVNRNNFSHDHGNFNHASGFHGGGFGHGEQGFHGGASSHAEAGTHSGALSGFDHGGNAQGFSSRGQSSFAGHGGGFSAGGGFHGGGGGHR
jgi:Protein of unknown function (DUF3300)